VSEALVLPAPEELFPVNPEILAKVYDLSHNNFDVEMLTIEERFMAPEWVTPVQAEKISVMRPVLRLCVSVMGCPLPVHVDIDTRVVEPGKTQRVDEWHTDLYLRSDGDKRETAIIISNLLSTQFAVGTVESEHPLAIAYRDFHAREVQSYYRTLENLDTQTRLALKNKEITSVVVGEGMAVRIDDRHLHNGTINDRKIAVGKCFIRVAPGR